MHTHTHAHTHTHTGANIISNQIKHAKYANTQSNTKPNTIRSQNTKQPKHDMQPKHEATKYTKHDTQPKHEAAKYIKYAVKQAVKHAVNTRNTATIKTQPNTK